MMKYLQILEQILVNYSRNIWDKPTLYLETDLNYMFPQTSVETASHWIIEYSEQIIENLSHYQPPYLWFLCTVNALTHRKIQILQ